MVSMKSIGFWFRTSMSNSKNEQSSLLPATAAFLLGLPFDHGDGGNTFLWNIRLSPNWTGLQYRILHSAFIRRNTTYLLPDQRCCLLISLTPLEYNHLHSNAKLKTHFRNKTWPTPHSHEHRKDEQHLGIMLSWWPEIIFLYLPFEGSSIIYVNGCQITVISLHCQLPAGTYLLTGSTMPCPSEPRPWPSVQPNFWSIWKPMLSSFNLNSL